MPAASDLAALLPSPRHHPRTQPRRASTPAAYRELGKGAGLGELDYAVDRTR